MVQNDNSVDPEIMGCRLWVMTRTPSLTYQLEMQSYMMTILYILFKIYMGPKKFINLNHTILSFLACLIYYGQPADHILSEMIR